MTRPYDCAYVAFLDWLLKATTIDEFDYADWLRANLGDLAADIKEGWTQDDVATFLRERFVSEKRIDIYPHRELQP